MLSRQSPQWSLQTLLVIVAVLVAVITTTTALRFDIERGWPTNPPHHYKYDPTPSNPHAIEFQTFTQWRDHFNPTDTQTFKQRWVENDEFFLPFNTLSPVFLYIGAEGPLNPKWMTSGIMAEFARGKGAKLIGLEHRYYGESNVVPSLSTPNMQWLTTYQALEDIAFFIKSFPDLAERPWVVFGGSYGGSLSAWARLKFPNLITAAISASGPFDPVVDYTDYLKVVESALQYYGGEKCVDALQEANQQLFDQYLKNKDQKKLDQLTTSLNLCTPLKSSMSTNDEQSFWQSLTDSFAGVCQYNKATVADGVLNLKKVCDRMISAPNKLDELIKIHYKVNDPQAAGECRNWDWAWQINQLSDLTPGSKSAARSWVYQTCTMYGFFQTNIGQTRAFGQHWEVEFFGKICQEVYGDDYNLGYLDALSTRFNATMNARDWRGRGVIFTNGNIDPWSALSIHRNSPYNYNYSHDIESTSHCATLYPSVQTDPPQLTKARELMFIQLGEILENYPFTRQ